MNRIEKSFNKEKEKKKKKTNRKLDRKGNVSSYKENRTWRYKWKNHN